MSSDDFRSDEELRQSARALLTENPTMRLLLQIWRDERPSRQAKAISADTNSIALQIGRIYGDEEAADRLFAFAEPIRPTTSKADVDLVAEPKGNY